MIQSSKSEYIKETLYSNKNDPKRFWRILNSTLLKGENTPSDITFNTGNDIYTEISDSCNYINKYFADIGKNLHAQFSGGLLNDYINMYNIRNCEDEIVFRVDDVVMLVKNINVHKGSGIEYMPSFILKDVFEVIPLQLTYLFNQSISLGVFPKSWAIATVTPIPKSGNKHQANNWRPISIIPLIGKLMEKLCNTIYQNHLDVHNILCDEQYGFRPKRSTNMAIFNFLKNIIDELNNKKIVGAIYLDFSKAFDSINHQRLLNKTKDMGIPLKLLEWTSSYLQNRKIKTRLNNHVSDTSELICGVPQGSVLGPTLFLCYINDLAAIIKNIGLSISLYADDAVIYCSNYDSYFVQARLENALSVVVDWCNSNYININIDKTKFCIYGTRTNVSKFVPRNLSSNNRTIHRCQQYQYLGIILDECLTMKPNFNMIFKKFSYKIYQFGKIKRFLNPDTRILVYKQTVLPLTEYVSFVMSLNTKHERDKLQKLQNRSLRICYDIQNPQDIRVGDIHQLAHVDMLDKRRTLQLLCILYELSMQSQYEMRRNRATRLAQKYIFDIKCANLDLYAKSPYCVGAKLWNDLPRHIQKQNSKEQFKHSVIDLI